MITLYPAIDGFKFDQNDLSTLTAVRYDRWFAGSRLNGYSRSPRFEIIADDDGRRLLAVSIDSLIDLNTLTSFWLIESGRLVYLHGDIASGERRAIDLDTAVAACNGGSIVDIQWSDRGLSRTFSGVKIWAVGEDEIGLTGSPINASLLRQGFRRAWIDV